MLHLHVIFAAQLQNVEMTYSPRRDYFSFLRATFLVSDKSLNSAARSRASFRYPTSLFLVSRNAGRILLHASLNELLDRVPDVSDTTLRNSLFSLRNCVLIPSLFLSKNENVHAKSCFLSHKSQFRFDLSYKPERGRTNCRTFT